jgi:phospholipase C
MKVIGRSARIRWVAAVAAAVIGVLGPAGTVPVYADNGQSLDDGSRAGTTTTPIQHLVVVFDENVSFDHYFATYPNAANPAGQPRFTAAAGTPTVNGLNDSLLDPNNPNSVQPFRLDRSQAQTCDQDHNYTDEQKAFDSGLMDLFVETVGRGTAACSDYGHGAGLTMGYYDGNTVTALWNYAQRYAMNDNSYGTTFGPSTPGALNLVAGQTHGFAAGSPAVTAASTVIGDPQPAGDKCDTRDSTTSTDPNNRTIGDALNDKHVTWGWFQGGFADCAATHTNIGGVTSKDYIPHHEPFQYFPSTANPQHLPPTSPDMIGKTDQANHQYDLTDFWIAVDHRNMPGVSFLKAPAYQDGHAGYSTPLDEQRFLVDTIDRLQHSRDWKTTAVVVAYDDSDGWYDHQMSPIVNQSQDPVNDALRQTGQGTDCGNRADPQHTLGGYQDRCGYGPRLPLLVISRYAKRNYVDHTLTDQSSILRFIEDNWSTGRMGNASFDSKAGSLQNMFTFTTSHGHDDTNQDTTGTLQLDPSTGQPG